MNRLIIIGNGFDKAHGLKTGYADFLHNYFSNLLLNGDVLDNKYVCRDQLVNVVSRGRFTKTSNWEELHQQIKTAIASDRVKLEFESNLLQQLYNGLDIDNWVNIEHTYYYLLTHFTSNADLVKKLNDDLDFLIGLLDKYIHDNVESVNEPNAQFLEIFNRDFCVDDYGITQEGPPENICLLNFNYTDTLKAYKDKVAAQNDVQRIDIHGQAGDHENPIVFGYGNELDQEYSKIENLNKNEFFRFTKSFMYLRNDNYHRLLRFVDSGDFEIFIIGHSCGLSDKTMLSYIFEQDKCKSIKLFYHKNIDHYTQLTYEMSRHFNRKSDMRKKITPFNEIYKCPQSKT